MSSGPNLPIPDATVTPLTPGEGDGTVAGDAQPGEGVLGQPTPDGSVAIPAEGTAGSPAAQPGEGVVVPPAAPGEPRPGQTAEERIQSLVTEVGTLKAQLADVGDVVDLADELEEVLVALRAHQVPSATPAPVVPAQPGQPTPVATPGVDPQIAVLTQTVQSLQATVQKLVPSQDEANAYKVYHGIEDKLLTDSGITNEVEVNRVKEMINKEMDAGKFDWTRPRVAKRVIRGQIAEFGKLKSDLVKSSVQPAAPTPAPATPGTPASSDAVPVTPESETETPLDQAAGELGPVLEQLFKKGGGVV